MLKSYDSKVPDVLTVNQMVTEWSPSGHPVVTKWSPRGHQMVTKWLICCFPCRIILMHYNALQWSPSGHQEVTKWSPSGHQVVTKWSPRGHHRRHHHIMILKISYIPSSMLKIYLYWHECIYMSCFWPDGRTSDNERNVKIGPEFWKQNSQLPLG